MDEFKKYLQENKSQLDIDEPRPLVWSHIEQQLKPTTAKISILKIMSWAVAACIIVLAGIGGWSLLGDKKVTIPTKDNSVVKEEITPPRHYQNDTFDGIQPIKEQSTVAESVTATVNPKQETKNSQQEIVNRKPDFINPKPQTDYALIRNIESSFTQVINLQRDRISTTPMFAETPAYFNDFKIEIRQLEKEEKAIKTEITKKGLINDHLDQLINLYQQKLNILKQLQLEMNKTNNRFKQNREPVDTTRTYFLSI